MNNNNINTDNSLSNPIQPSNLDIEKHVLKKCSQTRLITSLKSYMRVGYKYYLEWLMMTLGVKYIPFIPFCVARSMNKTIPIMGRDLEILFQLHLLHNESQFSEDILNHPISDSLQKLMVNSLIQEVHLDPLQAEEQTKLYINRCNRKQHPLHMTLKEFLERLDAVNDNHFKWVNQHSSETWRRNNTGDDNGTLSSVILPGGEIELGQPLDLPCPHHIGLQLFRLCGILKSKDYFHQTEEPQFTLVD